MSIVEAVSAWKCLVGDDAQIPAAAQASKMRAWDTPVVTMVFSTLEQAATNDYDRARLLACTQKGAGAWLDAPPIASLGLRLSNDAVRVSVGLRLGATIVAPHQCVCGNRVDCNGWHGLSCSRSAGRHFRHNAINNIIHRRHSQRSRACRDLPQ